MSDDAEIIGGLAEGERELRTRRLDYRARTFIVGGTIDTGLYVPPIHFADDVTVVGVAYELRTGTCNVQMFLHDDESFSWSAAVTTTVTREFDAFAEDLVSTTARARIVPYEGDGAEDLSFTIFYV